MCTLYRNIQYYSKSGRTKIDALKSASDEQAPMLAHRISERYSRGAVWHRLGQMGVDRDRFYAMSTQYAREQYRKGLSDIEISGFDKVVRYSDIVVATAKAYASGDKKAGFELLKQRNNLAYAIAQEFEALQDHIYFEQVNIDKLNAHAQSYAEFVNRKSLATDQAPLTPASNNIKSDIVTKTLKRLDANRISAVLMDNPEDTYLQIFGEPAKKQGNQWRYKGGLLVTVRGAKAGLWKDFSSDRPGGGPIQALMYERNISYKQALEEAGKMSGLSNNQLYDESTITYSRIKARRAKLAEQEKIEKQFKIDAARSIWEASIDARGSIVEDYMAEHRNIYSIEGMEIRYLPAGAKYQDIVDDKNAPHGIKLKITTNRTDALVIVSKDANGTIMGVQRTFLDRETRNKTQQFENPKRSKGIMENGAVIQYGTNGKVYIAEGAETAASIALADRDATVMVSTSVANMKNMITKVDSLKPQKVILLKDNDGVDAKTDQTFSAALDAFTDAGFKVSAKEPVMIDAIVDKAKASNKVAKTDWNDVLQYNGLNALREQVGIAVPQAYQYNFVKRLDEWRKVDHIIPDSVKDLEHIKLLQGFMASDLKRASHLYNMSRKTDSIDELKTLLAKDDTAKQLKKENRACALKLVQHDKGFKVAKKLGCHERLAEVVGLKYDDLYAMTAAERKAYIAEADQRYLDAIKNYSPFKHIHEQEANKFKPTKGRGR